MDTVFKEFPFPGDLNKYKINIDNFIDFQMKHNRKVAVITSGGTAVPLEMKTVRFIDNFSTGTRGSAAAEYFLNSEYAVLFLHRSKSLKPFDRHFDRAARNEKMINLLHVKDNPDGSQCICLDQTKAPKLPSVVRRYQSTKQKNTLLEIEFVTLCEYLNLLRVVSQAVHQLQKSAIIFLAAAVSDFYVPDHILPEHKLQSAEGPPEIRLHSVPKVMPFVTHDWAKNAFVVTFKLETDQSLLIPKSQAALKKYHHQVVVANILETRREKVEIVTPTNHLSVAISKDELASGMELEEKIISHLIALHTLFIGQG